MQVWDIASAVDSPKTVHNSMGRTPVSCLSFAPALPILVAGHSSGELSVLRHHGLDAEQARTSKEQVEALAAALHTDSLILQR
jgi:hypothetical protein